MLQNGFRKKIQSILDKSKTFLKNLIVINECCIDTKRHNYPELENEMKRISTNTIRNKIILKQFSASFTNFKYRFTEPLNYNRSILGQFIYPAMTYVHSQSEAIVKLDLNFAYLGALSSNQIKLPFGRKKVRGGQISYI